jgi:DNA-binding Xre family transcriptional regulator
MTKKITEKSKVYFSARYVCKYISDEWLNSKETSARKYGKIYGVNYHVIEKIQQEDGYNIPLSTLSTICFNHGIKLSEFFKLVEKKYGKFLNDGYKYK